MNTWAQMRFSVQWNMGRISSADFRVRKARPVARKHRMRQRDPLPRYHQPDQDLPSLRPEIPAIPMRPDILRRDRPLPLKAWMKRKTCHPI
jgi:hypothetical protein